METNAIPAECKEIWERVVTRLVDTHSVVKTLADNLEDGDLKKQVERCMAMNNQLLFNLPAPYKVVPRSGGSGPSGNIEGI